MDLTCFSRANSSRFLVPSMAVIRVWTGSVTKDLEAVTEAVWRMWSTSPSY